MKEGLTAKFVQNEEYIKKLISTNNIILVYAVQYDEIWGIGYSEIDAKALSKEVFNQIISDRNLFGKALMEVRKNLIINKFYPREYIFFLDENDDYGWLCNFFELPFTIDEITFLTNEHFYVWSKWKMFDSTNIELKQQIIEAPTGNAVKKLGSKIKNSDATRWDLEKVRIMKEGITAKFEQNEMYKKLLIDTGNKIIIETSPGDKFWGIGCSEENAFQLSKEEFNRYLKERNFLGKVLMEVREQFKT
jgi:ribA/ribD-fused uncharacterized protein